MQLRFEGLVAVVTGAAQGIGRAVAAAFCDAGATVVVCDLDAEGVAATAAELGISHQVLDLSDRSAVAEAMERIEQTCGPIDILVNAAGGVRGQVGRPIEEIDEEQWRTIFAANVDEDGFVDFFSPNGLLSKNLEDYEPRPSQERMAEIVTQALEGRHHAIVEAHERAQRRRIEAVHLEDIVESAAPTLRAFIHGSDHPGGLLLLDVFDPHGGHLRLVPH